jgi:hypothetical protein
MNKKLILIICCFVLLSGCVKYGFPNIKEQPENEKILEFLSENSIYNEDKLMLDLLYNNEGKPSLDYETIGVEYKASIKMDGYEVMKFDIVLLNNDGIFYRIPSYLLEPENSRGLIIGMHGHWGDDTMGKREFFMDEVNSFQALKFVKNNFSFFSYDAFLFDERKMITNNSISTTEEITFQKMFVKGYTPMELSIDESIVIVDLLKKLNYTNIVCVGHSMGCRKCLHLTAADKRIDSTYISGCITNEKYFYSPAGGVRESFLTILNNQMKDYNLFDLFEKISPRRLIIASGTYDPIYPQKLTNTIINKVAKIYHSKNAISNFTYVKHNGGHIVPPLKVL